MMKKLITLLLKIFFALLLVFLAMMSVLCFLQRDWASGLVWGGLTLLFAVLIALLGRSRQG